MKTYYKSDFEIVEEFLDVNGDPIDINYIDVSITYYTSGWERYTVSRIDREVINCVFDESQPTKLFVQFNEHELQVGILRREITLVVPNSNFPGGFQELIYNPVTDIELVAVGGDQGAAEVATVIPVLIIGHSADEKEDLVDTDEVLSTDSENEFKPVRTTWLKVKAFLKTAYDLVYAPILHVHSQYLTNLSELSGLETTSKTIEGAINEVRRIVLGSTPSWAFNTEAEMEAWLEVPANVAKLQIGNNLLIRELSVPDYWWDGTEALELEVKIDLSNYLTATQIANLYATRDSVSGKANLAGGNTFSGSQNFDSNTLSVDSVDHRVGIGISSSIAKLNIYTGGMPSYSGAIAVFMNHEAASGLLFYDTYKENNSGLFVVMSKIGNTGNQLSTTFQQGNRNGNTGDIGYVAQIAGEVNSVGVRVDPTHFKGWKYQYWSPSAQNYLTVFEVSPQGRLKITSSIKIADDTASASINNKGAIRYREDSNNSYIEMCMRTGSSTYAWVIIKQNSW